MAKIVEFLLPRAPVSHQSKSAKHKSEWQDYVYGRARQAWKGMPIVNSPLKFLMIYISEESAQGDINNFVKPVQDALNSCIYADDSLVKDVSAHMRILSEPNAITGLPYILKEAIIEGIACVYVAIYDSIELKEVL
ncbi:RusA family crossover junction endodeoxyribonuclease [Pantoea sp. GbtcB22]|uniref:RusA family crossover junction endodeoxyribonuclease n=1 Tax=Pantoea sp. GbtcB22 TaxID=2824767 RepID=UPI001C2FCA1C|nr:RusA family crossover junction endodeoxyribonuclease [Pantoea sp. GbtcB22]